MTVWLAVRTYAYEDEHGGVTMGVFSSEAAALAYAEKGRSADAGQPYTWDVEEWQVNDTADID